ncbi:MAG: hypothetical protein EXR98_23625 [Gemmataceae bacterium]|nr:hypothetical protein [Gemmataceae bacterium]
MTGGAGAGGFNQNPGANFNNPNDLQPDPENQARNTAGWSRGAVVVAVLIGLFVFLLLGAGGILIIVMIVKSSSGPGKKRKKSRRKTYDDDD